ncbi:hypothetical protein Pla8534_36520 [Lignipirellula cremea]|uniref:Uncharacterized protein n=1 Tax=Lignipirellula cremea TaxID=2528010 RepID=A0A518DVH9_9BACT|nr:hypothetical protein Pla8534_36520 [Lignipirellula cremea]
MCSSKIPETDAGGLAAVPGNEKLVEPHPSDGVRLGRLLTFNQKTETRDVYFKTSLQACDGSTVDR